jgi:hypothetical protein
VSTGVLVAVAVGFLCITGRIAISLKKHRTSESQLEGEGSGYSKPELEANEKRDAKETVIDRAELPSVAALHEAPSPAFGAPLHEVSSRELPVELGDSAGSRRRG